MLKREREHFDFEVLRREFTLQVLFKRQRADEVSTQISASPDDGTVKSESSCNEFCNRCNRSGDSNDMTYCESQTCKAAYHIHCIDDAVRECNIGKN